MMMMCDVGRYLSRISVVQHVLLILLLLQLLLVDYTMKRYFESSKCLYVTIEEDVLLKVEGLDLILPIVQLLHNH